MTLLLDKLFELCYNEVANLPPIKMKDEYLTKCVVDPLKRTVYLYSNEGSEKEVSCETVDEFMNVLNFIRSTIKDDILTYVNPL
jgi:hypothetical protein